MLVCDTHADTLYALSAPDRPAGGPLDVTAELLTAGGGVRVQCLALFVCTNGMRMSPTIVERQLQAFEGLKQRGFCQITELSQAREGVANAMLTIEGGEAFGGDAAQVDRFADLGVRMAALVWNNENGVAHPALSGSGVTVTLDDSPLWENAVNNNGTTANINDYVIHQQDVETVVNALWAGGADALMIMDQRVLFNSAVICSGNVLSLHGKKYSPPFTISAIGDPQRLRAALNDSEAITILKQYVTAFGIGYKVENAEDLQFPATAALLQQLKYATVDTSKTTDEEQTQQ